MCEVDNFELFMLKLATYISIALFAINTIN